MYQTSERYKEAILGSHKPIVRVRAMSDIQFGANPVGGLVMPINSGSVKMSATADIKSTLDMTVSGEFWSSLRPTGVEIFAERGIDYGDGTQEYIPLGYFRVQASSQDDVPDGLVKVAAYDRNKRLQEHRVAYPLTYESGVTHRVLFNRLINGYSVAPADGSADAAVVAVVANPMYYGKTVPITWRDYDPDTAQLPGGVVDDFIYDFLGKVVDARGCVLRFNRLGQLVVESRDRPPAEPSVYTIHPGELGNLVKVSRRVTRDASYSIVVTRGSDPAYPTGFSYYVNNYTDSQTNYQGPFEATIRKYASPLLRTYEQARLAGLSLIKRYAQGLPSGISVVILPDASLDPLDAITIMTSPPSEELADEITIPLVIQEPVTVSTRTKHEVTDDAPPPADPGGAGSPGGVSIYPAVFRDWRPHPNLVQPASGMTVVPVADSSDLATKLANATAGQVLTLAAGTYSGQFSVSAKGTASQPVVIRGSASVALAAGSTFTADNAEYVLITDIIAPYDQAGDTFVVKRACKFVRITKCVIGPASPGSFSSSPGNWIRITDQSADCAIDFCELRNKRRPGNGIAIDGDTSVAGYMGGCKHILVAHNDIHDFASEVTNGYEAVRFGDSGVSRTDSSSALIRNVFTNIACEPEVISAKMSRIDIYGNSIINCVGSVVYRHGTIGFMGHNYIRGPATGSLGTKTGGFRAYDLEQKIEENYVESANGSGYQGAVVIDGGDSGTPAINGHWPVKRMSAVKNVIVNCGTGILVGPNYTVPPDSIVVQGNVVAGVSSQSTAIKTIKAPTGSNVLSPNTYGADPAAAGLAKDVDGIWRMDGAGPRLTYLKRSNVGPAGDQTDGTGRSIGGAPGGAPPPGGVPATSVAKLLKMGKQSGFGKFNLGVGFDPNTNGGVHKDYTLAELENNSFSPSIVGYCELTPDGLQAKLSGHLDGGRTSTNTKYPRVEFRELELDGVTKKSFDPNKGEHWLFGDFTVDRMPPNKPQLVVGQSHDAADDTAMIYFNNKTTVYAKLGNTVVGTLTNSFAFGARHQYKLRIVGDGSKCYVEYYWDDMTTPKFTTASATRSTGWYLKGGCYCQSNTTYDVVSDGPFIVRFWKLTSWHTGYPTALGV